MDIKTLEKLEKQANIKLNEIEKTNFLNDYNKIVTLLDKMADVDVSEGLSDTPDLTLRTIDQEQDFQNQDSIISNVQHEVVNNSIKIKSVI